MDCVCRLVVEWSDEAGGAGLSQSQRYRQPGNRSKGSSKKYTAATAGSDGAADAAISSSDWAHIPVSSLLFYYDFFYL